MSIESERLDLEQKKKELQMRCGTATVKQKEYNGKEYYLESALQYVVDDYDELIDSVEASHFENLNYYEVINYYSPIGDYQELDFTWMNSDDVIYLPSDARNKDVKNILVNLDNLSSIDTNNKDFQGVNFEIYKKDSNMSFVNTIKSFKEFLRKSQNDIALVSLDGFPKVMDKILIKLVEKHGITAISKDNGEFTK